MSHSGRMAHVYTGNKNVVHVGSRKHMQFHSYSQAWYCWWKTQRVGVYSSIMFMLQLLGFGDSATLDMHGQKLCVWPSCWHDSRNRWYHWWDCGSCGFLQSNLNTKCTAKLKALQCCSIFYSLGKYSWYWTGVFSIVLSKQLYSGTCRPWHAILLYSNFVFSIGIYSHLLVNLIEQISHRMIYYCEVC